MPSVPEQLRAARESQKLSLHQVADLTKIKTDHLRALEEGRYETFSAPIYIRGFVRTYSTVLKLDPKVVLANLDVELSQDKRFKEPPSLLPQKRGLVDFVMLRLSRLKWQIVLPALVLLGAVVVYLWVFRSSPSPKPKNPVVNLGPGLYKPPAMGGDVLALPTNAPAR